MACSSQGRVRTEQSDIHSLAAEVLLRERGPDAVEEGKLPGTQSQPTEVGGPPLLQRASHRICSAQGCKASKTREHSRHVYAAGVLRTPHPLRLPMCLLWSLPNSCWRPSDTSGESGTTPDKLHLEHS